MIIVKNYFQFPQTYQQTNSGGLENNFLYPIENRCCDYGGNRHIAEGKFNFKCNLRHMPDVVKYANMGVSKMNHIDQTN